MDNHLDRKLDLIMEMQLVILNAINRNNRFKTHNPLNIIDEFTTINSDLILKQMGHDKK